MAVFADLAKRQHLRVGLRPVDEGALQPAVAAGPAQPGVDALGHFQRCTLAHHDFGHFTQIAQMHFGLTCGVFFFRFKQTDRKHLGDVVHHGLQQQQAPVFIFQRVEGARKQLRPDVVVNPARQLGGVHL